MSSPCSMHVLFLLTVFFSQLGSAFNGKFNGSLISDNFSLNWESFHPLPFTQVWPITSSNVTRQRLMNEVFKFFFSRLFVLEAGKYWHGIWTPWTHRFWDFSKRRSRYLRKKSVGTQKLSIAFFQWYWRRYVITMRDSLWSN